MRHWHKAAICLVAIPLGTGVAAAQVAGTWRVTGAVVGRAFVLDCRFEPRGDQLSGACTDTSTGEGKARAGKTYVLTRGGIQGDKIGWTYRTSVMFMSIDVDFAGTVAGARMSGLVTAAGRKGAFAATRK